MKPTLLYIGPADTLAAVRSYMGDDWNVHFAASESEIDRDLPGVEAILDASMKFRFDRKRLSNADQLRLVVLATTGEDHIDAAALSDRSIPLWSLKGQGQVTRDLTAAAEHSFLLLLACARRLPAAIDHTRRGEWDRTQFPGLMMNGKTLGIVGCGRIGQWMASYAAAFRMKAIGFDPHVAEWPKSIERRASLEDLAAEADALSVHVTLSPETKGLVSSAVFRRLKKGAVFVNTSRGEVVDEKALLAALESGAVAAAGLDVLTGEPDVAKHPLLIYARTHPNLIITPHIGGFSPEAVDRVLRFSCERLRGFFKN